MATKKATAKKVELTDTFAKIKTTAEKVNNQIMETATEVVEDVITNGKNWTNKATQTAKETIENIDIKKGFNQVKTTAGKINSTSLKVADTLVDDAVKNGKEWQGVAEKAIKGGLKLADKQQDIIFDTLETVKGQMLKNADRFRGLFSKN